MNDCKTLKKIHSTLKMIVKHQNEFIKHWRRSARHYRCLQDIRESSQRTEKDLWHIRNDCETLKLICEKLKKIKNLTAKNEKTCKILKCVYEALMQVHNELKLICKALDWVCETLMM